MYDTAFSVTIRVFLSFSAVCVWLKNTTPHRNGRPELHHRIAPGTVHGDVYSRRATGLAAAVRRRLENADRVLGHLESSPSKGRDKRYRVAPLSSNTPLHDAMYLYWKPK